MNHRLHFRQISLNQASQDNWDRGASHRRAVDTVIASVAGESKSLAILGAGNANDLDLPALMDRFAQMTLVDLDGRAMRNGVARQLGCDARPGISLCETDLTGSLERLSTIDRLSIVDAATMQALLATSRGFRPVIPGGPFDVVASTCLLSQILDTVNQTIAPETPGWIELVAAVRRQHLQTLVDLTAPGGTAILITDIVSSDTAPELMNEIDVAGSIPGWIESRNFFTGLNPGLIAQELRSLSGPQGITGEVVPAGAWRWQLGPRYFAVIAIVARRWNRPTGQARA